ncbi:MAG: hypothetical protein H7834_09105 [Magnetococcus sp. YQC-9]
MIGTTEEIWDVKEINICTSRSRENWMKISIFPGWFNIYLEPLDGCGKGHMETIDLEAAFRLRDFLIYALGSRQMGNAVLQRNEVLK